MPGLKHSTVGLPMDKGQCFSSRRAGPIWQHARATCPHAFNDMDHQRYKGGKLTASLAAMFFVICHIYAYNVTNHHRHRRSIVGLPQG
jgi:hypothetical protein